MKKTHVSIVGAGAVGVAVATSILHGRLASRVSLYDLDGDKAHGEALDLGHGAPLLGGPEVDGGPMEGASFGDLCVVTAGAKQRPGEDRLSLLARNERAMSSIADAFARRGMPRVVVMVTNPVDVMTEAMRRRLEPRGVVVLGSGTLLDTLRLRHALSRRLGISAESIHAHVVGEHGDTAVCLLDSARVGGYPLAEVFADRGLAFDEAFRAAIAEEVRGAAYRIIERKGATSHAIGVAVARIVRAVTHDERVVLPVSAPFEPKTSAAVPCVIGAQGAEALPLGALSARERAELDVSFGVLRARCAELGRG
jgi:L-lactate dehydrogenase